MPFVKGSYLTKTVYSKHHGIFCISQCYQTMEDSNYLRQSPQFDCDKCEIIVANRSSRMHSDFKNWLHLDGEMLHQNLKQS